MEPSKLQQAILNAYQGSRDNIVINAVAGSGKTSTLKMLSELTQNNGESKLYLAFNREIVEDVLPKLEPLGVFVSTFHSLGFSAIKAQNPSAKVDKWKYRNLLTANLRQSGLYDLADKGIGLGIVCRSIDALRVSLSKITPGSFEQALDANDVDFTNLNENHPHWLEKLTTVARNTVLQGVENDSTVDFIDMISLPVLKGKYHLPGYDLVMIDEMQDLNLVMQRWLSAFKKAGSRIVGVGDPHQAIYAFAGADSNSFYRSKDLISAVEFPLSVCYRCHDEALDWARDYVPHIEGTQRSGVLSAVEYGDMPHKLAPKDLVLCRTNAPLVDLALELITLGKPVKIKGKDFGQDLISWVKKTQKTNPDFAQFDVAFNSLMMAQARQAKSEDKLARLQDYKDCFDALRNDPAINSYEDLLARIDALYSEKAQGSAIVLSTFHKSKGIEADTVWILKSHRFPASMTEDQEGNLAYVAITRAKKVLNVVEI
jgi:superfamily I DNA/RNA helicase